MIALSRRYAQIPPSPTLALDARAKALAAEGTKVLNFAVGEPDFSAPQAVVEATIAALKQNKTRYGVAGGGQKLRELIAAKLLRENKLTFDPSQIVAGIGAKEILFHLFLTLLEEGDEVLLPTPYWVSYTSHAIACGAKCVTLPLAAEAPRITKDMVERALTPRTKLVMLNSPNNPAGYVLSESELRAIGEALRDKNVWIISDEIYEYLAFDRPHVSLLTLMPELKDRFILVNGLSKGYAMTGFRVGYCAAPEPVAKLVRTLESQSSTCLPPFIEEGAIKALELGPGVMADDIAKLRSRRDLAVKRLKEIPDTRFLKPEGAFYVFIDVRDALKHDPRFKNDDTLAFSRMLLEEHHVAMVPGEAFGTKGFLRLSYAVNNEDLEEGIARLAQALKALRHG